MHRYAINSGVAAAVWLIAGAAQAAPPVAVIDAPSGMGVKTRFTIMANRSSDPDGQIIGYLWRVGGGAEVFTEGPSIDVRIPAPGAVEFSLIAIDNQWQLSAPVTARVIARDQTSPVAVLDLPASGRVGEAVTLDARRSTDEGRIVRYQWTIGTAAPIATDQPQLRHSFTAGGNQTVRLIVMDEAGNTSAPVEGTLNIINPPVAVVQVPSLVAFGQAISLDGRNSSSAGGRIVAYRWQINGGTPQVSADPIRVQPALPMGRYTVSLSVDDDSGARSAAATAVFVVADQTAPVAVIQGPIMAQVGTPVEFSAQASSDVGGRLREYRWQIGGETFASDQPILKHTFAATGVQSVVLTVMDESGNTSAPVTQRVTVQSSVSIRLPVLTK
ncbi:MAG: PKD domain-containing protein [Asticcacaulis sp.]